MPTVGELHQRLQYLVDDQVEADQAIILFNEALEDLSEVGDYEKEETIPLPADVRDIPLPDDYIKGISVYVVTEGKEYLAESVNRASRSKMYGERGYSDTFQYEEFPETLKLVEAPNQDYQVIIRYQADYPSIPLTNVDPTLEHVPKIPNRFHRGLSLFAAFRYYENWEDNSGMRSELFEQYSSVKAQLRRDGNRRSQKRRNNRVVQTRGWF